MKGLKKDIGVSNEVRKGQHTASIVENASARDDLQSTSAELGEHAALLHHRSTEETVSLTTVHITILRDTTNRHPHGRQSGTFKCPDHLHRRIWYLHGSVRYGGHAHLDKCSMIEFCKTAIIVPVQASHHVPKGCSTSHRFRAHRTGSPFRNG